MKVSDTDLTGLDFDFIILCTQRTGSHMLASALNAHPDISCCGELRPKDIVVPSSGDVTGAILMYSNWRDFGVRVSASKIIHLVRDPDNTAKSRLVNNKDKEEQKKKHKAHFLEKVDRGFEIDVKQVGDLSGSIRKKVKRARGWIRDIPHIEVTYEELTENVSVSQLPTEVAKRITDFLGLSYAPLITELVKPNTTYTLLGEEE